MSAGERKLVREQKVQQSSQSAGLEVGREGMEVAEGRKENLSIKLVTWYPEILDRALLIIHIYGFTPAMPAPL